MWHKRLDDDEKHLWDYICQYADKTGTIAVPVEVAAKETGMGSNACLFAADGLVSHGLVWVSNLAGGQLLITISREGLEYKDELKRESEMIWSCPYCGHADKDRQQHREHMGSCDSKPHKTGGGMGLS